MECAKRIFFDIAALVIYIFFHRCYSAWIPLVKKVINSINIIIVALIPFSQLLHIHFSLLALSFFVSPLPNNKQRKYVYICKDTCQYIRKYTYICMHEQQHIHKHTNIQKHTKLGTYTNKYPHTHFFARKLSILIGYFLKLSLCLTNAKSLQPRVTVTTK